MSRDLASNKINDELFAYPDRVFYGEAVPQNTSKVSDAILFGKTLDALELVGAVNTDIALADTKVLSISVAWDEAKGGSYTNSQVLYSVTASGATTIDAGTELFRYVADHTKPVYYKVTITTDDAAATGTFDVQIGSVRK